MNKIEKAKRLRALIQELMVRSSSAESAFSFSALDLSRDFIKTVNERKPEHENVLGAYDGLVDERELEDHEFQVLEAVVLPTLRPVVDIVCDTYATPPYPWLAEG